MSINFKALGGLFTFKYINDVEDMDIDTLYEAYAEIEEEYQGMKNDCKELKKELDKLKEVIERKKPEERREKIKKKLENDKVILHNEDIPYEVRMKYIIDAYRKDQKKWGKLAEYAKHLEGEVCKTSYKTADGNIPCRVAIENLRIICEEWLEDLRYSTNVLYGGDKALLGQAKRQSRARQAQGPVKGEQPIIITSGYRSAEVNKLAGGSPTSNHLTGCAVDIRCIGIEQSLRYANILLDIADGTKRDFDELFIERNKQGHYWIHFAVRPKDNRNKVCFLQT